MTFYKRKPDIIIKNGAIVDGTGAPTYYADIAIIDDKIDYIGDLKGVDAPLVIDAHHKYVTPGFIDGHSHVDFTLWAAPEVGNHITQGITTAIPGCCGYSMRHKLPDVPFDSAGDSVKCVISIEKAVEKASGSAANLYRLEDRAMVLLLLKKVSLTACVPAEFCVTYLKNNFIYDNKTTYLVVLLLSFEIFLVFFLGCQTTANMPLGFVFL